MLTTCTNSVRWRLSWPMPPSSRCSTRLNLPSLRTSNTVFILGSGWSINEIPDHRWKLIGATTPSDSTFGRCTRSCLESSSSKTCAPASNRTCTAHSSPPSSGGLRIIATRSRSQLSPIPNHSGNFCTNYRLDFRENLYVGYTAPVTARTEAEARGWHGLPAFARRV